MGALFLVLGTLGLLVSIFLSLYLANKGKKILMPLIGIGVSIVVTIIGIVLLIQSLDFTSSNWLDNNYNNNITDNTWDIDDEDDSYIDDYEEDSFEFVGEPTGESFTYEFTQGKYMGGHDIAPGIYKVTTDDLNSVTARDFDHDYYVYEYLGDSSKTGDLLEMTLYVDTTTTVKVTGTGTVKFVSQDIYGITTPLKSSGESVTLKTGDYKGSIDIAAGRYDLTLLDDDKDSYISLYGYGSYGDLCNEKSSYFCAKTYKNFEVDNSDELEIEDYYENDSNSEVEFIPAS